MYSERAEEDSEQTCRNLGLCFGVGSGIEISGSVCSRSAVNAECRAVGKLLTAISTELYSVSYCNSAMNADSCEIVYFFAAIFTKHDINSFR